jgi:hypothetical protein
MALVTREKRDLTEEEIQAIDETVKQAAIDLRQKLVEEYGMNCGIMVTAAFPLNQRFGFFGFPGERAAKDFVIRLAEQWSKKPN